MGLSKLKYLVADLPKGPLEAYRKRASFDWKLLKLHVFGEDCVRFENSLWKYMESQPEFHKKNGLTLDEERRICCKRINSLLSSNIVHPMHEPQWFNTLFLYDGSIPVKMGIMNSMATNSAYSLGTERHYDVAEKFKTGEYTACFALTEIAHGTNVKGMRATATYDKASNCFILHTANFEAAKCWAGGLGKTATHAVIFAKLITPDGINRGLHTFIVPIRDPKTFLPYPGVTVGDMGEKIGLNGVDNGFVMFDNYRIPRECLLNKHADVSEDGTYVAAIKDTNKRFSASLGALSTGRVSITSICSHYASVAIVIAIRYCAARKQFGPNDTEEWSVIEYQAQQWRLFPHLAATYALKIFSQHFIRVGLQFHMDLMGGGDQKLLAAQGIEIHALSSAGKPLCAWTARDIIQDCRESCGGHGYLKMSRLGDLRAENDANCTYEGENNVLLQQASNWLISLWSSVLKGNPIDSPMHSADFLMDAENILSAKFHHTTVNQTIDVENLLFIAKWLVCYYLKGTYGRVQSLKSKGYSNFETRNDSQTFFAHTLSILYAQHAALKYFYDFVNTSDMGIPERTVMLKLCSLYGATNIEKRLGDLYMGGYASQDSGMGNLLREGIILLCKELVGEAVSLVDVLSPPDFILNSPLGMADGEVYKHMKEWIFRDKENQKRPVWWGEVLSKL